MGPGVLKLEMSCVFSNLGYTPDWFRPDLVMLEVLRLFKLEHTLVRVAKVTTILLVWGEPTVAFAQSIGEASRAPALPSNAVNEQEPPPAEVIPPQVLTSVQAPYPEDALRERIEGRVIVGLVIASDGTVRSADVIESPSLSLGAAAQEALLRFRFVPARVGADPKAVRIRYAYEFRLPPVSEPIIAKAEAVAKSASEHGVPQASVVAGQAPVDVAEADTGAGESNAGAAEVVVRGYREGQRLSRSAAAVTVVELERAKRESGDMGTVLSRVEGVSVQQVGGLGSPARFNLGGFDDTQVRFFIDGIPLEYQGFSLGIQNVPLNLVERVEVYKGVLPIQFGADSLGGALNLVTDRSTAGARVSGSYQGGSFDTHRASASARYLEPKTGLFFKGEGFLDTTDNDYEADVLLGDMSGQSQPRTVRRFHDGYSAHGGNAEVGLVNVDWARRLLLRGFATSYHKELQHNARMTTPYGQAAYGGFSSGLSLRHEYDAGLGVRSGLIVGYVYERSDFVDDPGDCIYSWLGQCRPMRRDGSGELRPNATDQTLWDRTGYARWNLRWEVVPNHEFALSTAPSFFTRTGKDDLVASNAFTPIRGRRDMFKWISGAEYRVTAFDEQLENVLLVKSYLNTGRSDELLGAGATVERSTQRVYWGVGDALRYGLTDWAITKLSYEYSVRLPEPREVFGNGAQIGENLELEPERSHNLNLGILVDGLETDWGTINGSVTGFYRDAEDLVVLLGRSEIFFYENVLRASVTGIEAAATWVAPSDFLEIGANVTYQDLRNRADRGQFEKFEGDRVPNKPYLFANGRVRLQKAAIVEPGDALSVTWYTRYVHRFSKNWESVGLDLDETPPIVDSQLVHSAAVTYVDEIAGGRQISFSLEAQNLADSKVFDFYGVQKPGRMAFFKTVLAY